jgi:hypothetical protein
MIRLTLCFALLVTTAVTALPFSTAYSQHPKPHKVKKHKRVKHNA